MNRFATATVTPPAARFRALPHRALDAGVLPLFPLNMVLFPDGILPLRIFEPRYLDLVSRCLRDEICFVTTLITRGVESGEAEYNTVGTTARIVDWDRGPDGMLHVEAIGGHIVRIRHSAPESNGLYVGEVEIVALRKPTPMPMRHHRLAELVSTYLSELKSYRYHQQRPDDAHWLADRLCELLPLSLSQRQALLEESNALARLDALHRILPESVSA